MPVPRSQSRNQTVVQGFQDYLVIDSAPVGAKSLEGTLLKDAGSLTVAGLYKCYLDVQGLANLYVTLKPSAVTGTFAPALVSTYADQATTRTTAAGPANFIANTLQTLTVALAGEKRCILSFTIPGGGAINFSTNAEANGL